MKIANENEMYKNGDEVQVAKRWHPTEKAATAITAEQQHKILEALKARNEWRKDVQSPDWIGVPIAEALSLDPKTDVAKQTVKGIISTLEAWKVIKPVEMKDAHRNTKDGYTVHSPQYKMDLGPGKNPLA